MMKLATADNPLTLFSTFSEGATINTLIVFVKVIVPVPVFRFGSRSRYRSRYRFSFSFWFSLSKRERFVFVSVKVSVPVQYLIVLFGLLFRESHFDELGGHSANDRIGRE